MRENKKQDIAGLKIRLYEEQQPIIQQQINQWQQAFSRFSQTVEYCKSHAGRQQFAGSF